MTITPNTDTFVNVATLVISDVTVTTDRWNLLRAMDVSDTTKKMVFMLYHNPIVLTGNDIYKFTDPDTGQYVGADYQPVTEYSGYVYKFFIYPILCLNEALYRGALSAEHVNSLIAPLHLTTDDLYTVSFTTATRQPSIDDYVAYWNGIQAILPDGRKVQLITGIDPDHIDPQRKNIVDDETLGKNPTTEQLFSGLYSLLSFQLASTTKWAYEAYPKRPATDMHSKAWYQTTWANNNLSIGIRMYVLEDKNVSNMCPKPFEGYFTQSGVEEISSQSYNNSGFNLILVGVEQKPEPEPPTT